MQGERYHKGRAQGTRNSTRSIPPRTTELLETNSHCLNVRLKNKEWLTVRASIPQKYLLFIFLPSPKCQGSQEAKSAITPCCLRGRGLSTPAIRKAHHPALSSTGNRLQSCFLTQLFPGCSSSPRLMRFIHTAGRARASVIVICSCDSGCA